VEEEMSTTTRALAKNSPVLLARSSPRVSGRV